jgi:hypothetical protein
MVWEPVSVMQVTTSLLQVASKVLPVVRTAQELPTVHVNVTVASPTTVVIVPSVLLELSGAVQPAPACLFVVRTQSTTPKLLPVSATQDMV